MATRPKLQRMATPAGIAVWPRLNTPDTKFKPQGEYTTGLRLSMEEAAPLVEALDRAYDEGVAAELQKLDPKKRAKAKRADKPYREELDEDGNSTGMMLFRFKMAASGESKKTGEKWERRPALFDAKRNPLVGKNVGGGSTIRVSFEIMPFFTDLVGAGISLRLIGVQVLDLVEFGGQSAESMGFDEEDGFVSQAAPDAPAARPDTTGVAVDTEAEGDDF